MKAVKENEAQNLGGVGDESPRPAPERGRWWGAGFCPHPGEPCIDGCYYCGRAVGALDGRMKDEHGGSVNEYSVHGRSI